MWAVPLRALILQRPWPSYQGGNTRGRNTESVIQISNEGMYLREVKSTVLPGLEGSDGVRSTWVSGSASQMFLYRR